MLSRHVLRVAIVSLVAALLAALVTLVTSGAATAAGGKGDGDDGDVAWAIRTAANRFGDGRQNYSYTLAPGGSLRDAIVITNHGTAPITLAVYAADGFTTDGGQLDLLRTDQESTGVGAWVRPARGTVTVAPEKSVSVPFRLTLPDNATPGDHLGGIITSLTQEGSSGGINVDRRLAMRIRLRVSGDLKPQLSVEDLRVSYDGTANPAGAGGATVDYTIRNTGNAILAARQDVSVAGPFGWLRTSADDVADTPELLPGEEWHVSVPVDDVRPTGRISARVRLTPLLTDAAGSVNTLDQVEATTHAWALPWTLVLAILLLVAAAAGWLLRVRRRRAADRDREDARVQAAVDQALRDRAQRDHELSEH